MLPSVRTRDRSVGGTPITASSAKSDAGQSGEFRVAHTKPEPEPESEPEPELESAQESDSESEAKRKSKPEPEAKTISTNTLILRAGGKASNWLPPGGPAEWLQANKFHKKTHNVKTMKRERTEVTNQHQHVRIHSQRTSKQTNP